MQTGNIERAFLALGILATVSACSDPADLQADDLATGDAARLGRIHVMVEADDEVETVANDIAVTARFVYFRGIDEAAARSRTDTPLLATDLLSPGQCVLSRQLEELEPSDDPHALAELTLVDAGDLQLEIGRRLLDVPLTLIPDLLPYMSGVEYVYRGENTIDGLEHGATAVRVFAAGSPADELAPFHAEGLMPPIVELADLEDSSAGLAQGQLRLHWLTGETTERPVVLEFVALLDNAPIGDEMTCAWWDVGHATLDLRALRAMGLGATDEGLRATVSRFARSTFDAGEFAGNELLLETRDTWVIETL